MAIITVEGFEYAGDTATWSVTGTASRVTSGQRSGDACARANPTGSNTGYVQTGAVRIEAVRAASFYFKLAALPGATEQIFRIFSDSGAAWQFLVTSAGVGQFGIVGGSLAGSTVQLQVGVWNKVQFQHDTNIFKGRINDVEIVSDTTATAPRFQFLLYCGKETNLNGGSIDVYYDDLICDDSASAYPLAGGRVIMRMPAAGLGTPTYNAWTKSSGTDAGALWDNNPFDATDFCSTNSSSAAQTSFISPWSSGTSAANSSDTLFGGYTGVFAKTSATTSNGTNLNVRQRINGVDTGGLTNNLTTSTTWKYVVGTGFWFTGTLANLDAMQVGVYTTLSTRTRTVYDVVAMLGYQSREISMGATEASDTFAATLSATTTPEVSLGATEAADTFAATLRNQIEVTVGATEGPDVFAANLRNQIGLSLAATEAADVFAASIHVYNELTLGATESPDVFAATMRALLDIHLTATESPDVFAAALRAYSTAELLAVEAPDVFAATLDANAELVLAATEAQDTFAASLSSVSTEIALAATEAADTFAAATQPTPVKVVNLTTGSLTAAVTTATTASVNVPDKSVVYISVGVSQTGFNSSGPVVSISGLSPLVWTRVGTELTYGGRRTFNLFRAINITGGTVSGTITINAAGTNGGTPSEYGWVVDLATEIDLLNPNDAAISQSVTSVSSITLADVGTPDIGDRVYGSFVTDISGSSLAIDASYTQVGAIRNLGSIRQIVTGYDITDPQDETPGASWTGTSNGAGFGIVLNRVPWGSELFFNDTEAADTFAATLEALTQVELAATEAADVFAATLSVQAVEVALDATESPDTFAGTLEAIVAVDLNATEAADTFAASLTTVSLIQLGATEAPDVFAAAIDTDLAVSLAATESADTFAASMTLVSPLSLAATEQPDIFAAAIDTDLALSLSATEVADTFAASLTLVSLLSVGATEQPDTFAGALDTDITLSFGVTEEADTFSGVLSTGIGVFLIATEDPDTFAGELREQIGVALGATEQPDTLAASLTLVSPMTLAATEAPDTFSGAMTLVSLMSMAAVEAPDTFAGAIDTNLSVGLAATEAQDTFAAQLTLVSLLSLGATEAPDTFAATIDLDLALQLAATEAADTFSATLSTGVGVVLAATEVPDIFAGTLDVQPFDVQLTATESPDTLAATLSAGAAVALDATEDPDTFDGAITVQATALQLGATEAPDVMAAALDLDIAAQLAATEEPDTLSATIDTNVAVQLGATEEPDTMAATLSVALSAALAATEDPDQFSAALRTVFDAALASTEDPDVFDGTVLVGVQREISLGAVEEPDEFDGTLVGPALPEDGVLAPKFQGLRYPNVTRQWVGDKKKGKKKGKEEAPEPGNNTDAPIISSPIALEPAGAALGIVIPQFVQPTAFATLPEAVTAPPAAQTPAALPVPEQGVAEQAGGATTTEPTPPIEPIPPAPQDYVLLDDLERIMRDVDHAIGVRDAQIKALQKESAANAAALARSYETVLLMQKSIDELRRQLNNQKAALLAMQMLED